MAKCNVCFRHCEIGEGQTGFCGARICWKGEIHPAAYGRITSIALDPIEKKPLRRFHPGEMILSVGSYGCNLRCPFCQNNSITWSEQALELAEDVAREQNAAEKVREQSIAERVLQRDGVSHARRNHSRPAMHVAKITPQRLAEMALEYAADGNMGLAFTYNEPLVGYEFVRDTARLVHQNGQYNVLVTNGTAEPEVLEELLPWIDAMNIDLKGFTDHYYEDVLGGSRTAVLEFIAQAAEGCHVELTTLIVPGENDSEEEIRRMASWIAGIDPAIPLHISRFFPQFHMTDRLPTDVGLIYHLAEVAREYLPHVYTGNC